MSYKVWVEDHNDDLQKFENARDALELPTGEVRVITEDGEEETVLQGNILRLKNSDA